MRWRDDEMRERGRGVVANNKMISFLFVSFKFQQLWPPTLQLVISSSRWRDGEKGGRGRGRGSLWLNLFFVNNWIRWDDEKTRREKGGVSAFDCNSVSGLISRCSSNSMATSDLDRYYRLQDVFTVKYHHSVYIWMCKSCDYLLALSYIVDDQPLNEDKK